MEILKITEWEHIDWSKIRDNTLTDQIEIYKAADNVNQDLVKELQWSMINNPDNKLLATRRITQDNQGWKAPGIDKIGFIPPKDRIDFALSLEILGKCSPMRIIYIKKPNGEDRPLKIPTIEDRAKQGLVKLALEPEWEAKFEPQSFGFRPGRSPKDANKAIYMNLRANPKFILDADIWKCFETINHKALMEKMDNPPVIQNQIWSWLWAGFHDEFYNTVNKINELGTPQGSIISPLLCNIVLNGIREAGMEKVKEFKGSRQFSKNQIISSYSLIRYADNFIAFHPHLDVLEAVQKNIIEFLKPLNLELHPDKTRIIHSMERYNGQDPGFTFLSCHYHHTATRKNGECITGNPSKGSKVVNRACPVGDLRGNPRGSPKSKMRHYNWAFRSSPDKGAIVKHLDGIRSSIRKCKNWPQDKLINLLNPQIRGWSNYFSNVPHSEAFSFCDHIVFQLLYKWGLSWHPNKGKVWVTEWYFHENIIPNKKKKEGYSTRKWTFATKHKGYLTNILCLHWDTKLNIDMKPMEIDYSPFNPKHADHKAKTLLSEFKRKLFDRQKGLCLVCGSQILFDDLLEVHHLITDKNIPERNRISLIWLIHGHCHDKVHSCSGSQSVIEEEPYDA